MRTRRMLPAALVLSLLPAAAATATGVVGPTNPDEAFRAPGSYDFAIAHITDTQYLSQCANGAGIFPSMMKRCQAIYNGMNRWIVDNADNRKIAYTAHTGDIIDSYHLNTPLLAKGEFAKASTAQAILDEAGMPNGVMPGNHDNRVGKDASLYNAWFGPQRYADKPWYAGPWKPGDNSNHVDEFMVGEHKFAVVHLGYGVTAEEAAWADAQIDARPDTNVIVATHAYLLPGAGPSGLSTATSDDGALVRDVVVKPNANVFLVLSGHEHGVGRNVLTGTDGHPIVEIVADYQAYWAGWDGLGHAGFIRMMQFDLDNSEMTVDTFSPSLDSFRSRDYDTKIGRKYDGTEDEWTVKISLVG